MASPRRTFLIVALALAVAVVFVRPSCRHRTEHPIAKFQVAWLQRIRLQDVERIEIMVGHKRRLYVLKAPADTADIRTILESLQHITVADRPAGVGTGEWITVVTKKHGSSLINLVLDPGLKPVVSDYKRSPDLANKIAEITRRHKGQ